ncbi:MAG: LPXTG cell wall anchor domain-containing protein [Oscillospiraceae bacterium]|nr:LPXTG cell wall anchor domain-containing protein [Oscillospiraceae bacterium]
MKKIVTLSLTVLLLASLTLLPAMAQTPAQSPFVFTDQPASAWGTNHPDQMVGAANAAVSTTGGEGNPIVFTRTGYGWPSAVFLFDGPMAIQEGHELHYDFDIALTREAGDARPIYVRILAAIAPDSNSTPSPEASFMEITIAGLEPGRQTGSLRFFTPNIYGIWIQMVCDSGTLTVYGLNIGDELVLVEGAPEPPPPGETPTPTPPPTTATPTPGTTATTPPPAGTGTAAPGQGNPKTSDAGVAMIVMTGLAGLAGAGLLVGKKRK